jgi:hypothetical protein
LSVAIGASHIPISDAVAPPPAFDIVAETVGRVCSGMAAARPQEYLPQVLRLCEFSTQAGCAAPVPRDRTISFAAKLSLPANQNVHPAHELGKFAFCRAHRMAVLWRRARALFDLNGHEE